MEPNNVIRWERRVNDYIIAHRFGEAIELCSTALTEGNSSKLLICRAIAYLRLRRFQEAEFDLKSALSVEPSNVEVKMALADVYIQTGRASEVATCLRGVNTPEAQTVITLATLWQQSMTSIRERLDQFLGEVKVGLDGADSLFNSLSKANDFIYRLSDFTQTVIRFTASYRCTALCECVLAQTLLLNQVAVDLDVYHNSADHKFAKQRSFINSAIQVSQQALNHAQLQGGTAIEEASLTHAAIWLSDTEHEGGESFLRGHVGTNSAGYHCVEALDRYTRLFKAASKNVSRRNFERAIEQFRDSISAITNQPSALLAVALRHHISQCHAWLAVCYEYQHDIDKALIACDMALQLCPIDVSALNRHAALAKRKGDMAMARRDYQVLMALSDNRVQYDRYMAEFNACQNTRPPEPESEDSSPRSDQDSGDFNPYTILGLDQTEWLLITVPDAVLNRAYRAKCKQWHPDRWSGAGESERRKAEEMIVLVNRAYDVLRDPQQKLRFDKTRVPQQESTTTTQFQFFMRTPDIFTWLFTSPAENVRSFYHNSAWSSG